MQSMVCDCRSRVVSLALSIVPAAALALAALLGAAVGVALELVPGGYGQAPTGPARAAPPDERLGRSAAQ